MLALLRRAGVVAAYVSGRDPRKARIGAVGIRRDGVTVVSRNGGALVNHQSPRRQPTVHAERRCARKMDGGVIYVARVLADGNFAMARPCYSCQLFLKAKGVRRVYYTISSLEYGVLDL